MLNGRPASASRSFLGTFGEPTDPHIDDMSDVGKSPRRSKAAALVSTERKMGRYNRPIFNQSC